MKRFETPVMNVEKFELTNILTTSAVDAVETAKAELKNMGITDDKTFTITL